jgi:glycine/D-amino acid oxidase-like deaminating enzyme
MDYIDPAVLKQLTYMQPTQYWLDADPIEPESRASLVESLSTDLCIVGGGYTGLWTALLAKEENPSREVVILEAKETGAGASGRNGGFCNSSLTHGFLNGYQRFPNEMSKILRMGQVNLDEIEKTIEKYQIDCDWKRTGELKVATEPWQIGSLHRELKLRQSFDDEIDFLTEEQLRARIKSPRFFGALWDEDGTALVDPARLVWGLERACLSLGVLIFEHTPALKLSRSGEEMKIQTPYGHVTANKVALATNVYRPLIRRARKYVVPVYDYQIVTEPLTEEQMSSIGWNEREGISEAGNQFHYYRLTSENEILWGGYDAVYNFRGQVRSELENDHEVYARLARDFFSTFPQLRGIRFTHGWGGAIDTCSRFAPFWGLAHRGHVAYVLGYTGLGVASSRFGARVMLDLLDKKCSEFTELEMVKRKPIPFPPEPIRFLFIKLTQWSIAKADSNQGKRNLWLRILDKLGLGFDS